jgi:GTP-binding protein
MRALKSVDKADVALFVLDGTQGVTQQDQRLCERVDAAGCPIVLVLNKMDLMSTEAKLDLTDQIERRLSFLPTANPERISALTGKGVERLMPSLAGVVGEFQKRIPTKDVNKVVRLAQQAQPAPAGARVLYATQGATDPPTFTLFSNKEIGDSYLRYIERELRAKFEMGSTPIKIRVRLRNE